jgi:DNA repair exonuclease SbcCD nuclease subunit
VPAWLAEAAFAPLKRVAASGVPVLLVPGNHERARLPYPLLAVHERLHVFDRPRTFVLEVRGVRAAFTGFPYASGVRRQFPALLAAARRDGSPSDIRVLCMHQCVEGATCGPGNYTFRSAPDVVRAADLPRDCAAVLSGHIHRHQVLRPAGRPPVIYAGSVERTSFAEAPEIKGYIVVDVTPDGLGTIDFRRLPARPMLTREVSIDGVPGRHALDAIAAAVATTPEDAVLRLRIDGDLPATVTAEAVRGIAGARNVSIVPSRPVRASLARRRERIDPLSGSQPALF